MKKRKGFVSGKTVIPAKIEEELKSGANRERGWIVFDLNPTRDMLGQIAQEGDFGRTAGLYLSGAAVFCGLYQRILSVNIREGRYCPSAFIPVYSW